MYGYYEYVDLTPHQVLQKVSQRQIFEWIMGEPIIEGKLYKSPLREDKHPKCRFDTLVNGDILFTDYGDYVVRRSCFRMAMDFHQASLQSVITMICDKFKLSKNSNDYSEVTTPISFESSLDTEKITEIYWETRKFDKRDARYWNLYSITEQQLREDKVYPVSKVTIINHKKNKRSNFKPQGLCYAITFGDAVKLYQPYNPMYKFITNCTIDHIGNIQNVVEGKPLIVAKAYKDHRVLRNLGRPNTIWFPSENIIPSITILRDLCSRFPEIVIFFDNDEPGIAAAYKLQSALDDIDWGLSRIAHIPFEYNRKDLAEFLNREGKQDSIKLLKQLDI